MLLVTIATAPSTFWAGVTAYLLSEYVCQILHFAIVYNLVFLINIYISTKIALWITDLYNIHVKEKLTLRKILVAIIHSLCMALGMLAIFFLGAGAARLVVALSQV
jgi:hypothetical protein